MGKRGSGDQSDPQPPYGQPGDGQWHMGNYLREGQENRITTSTEAVKRGFKSKGDRANYLDNQGMKLKRDFE